MGKKKGSHLVPVKKMITRNGKTFETTVLVNPNKMNTVEEGGNIDIPIEKWTHIKTLEDFDKCRKEIVETKDVATRDALKTEFIQYLRASGVHFERCPHNANVDYMRCLTKAKKLIERGEFVAKDNPEGHHKLQAPKLYKSKQEARKLCQEFSKNFEGSREELHQFLKDNGVQWKECEHEGINHMRAMMELREMLEEGKDVPFMNEHQSDNPNYSKQQKILDGKRLATHNTTYGEISTVMNNLSNLNTNKIVEYVEASLKKIKGAVKHTSKKGTEHHISGDMYEVNIDVQTVVGGNQQAKIGLYGSKEEAEKVLKEYQQQLKEEGYKTKKEFEDNEKKEWAKVVHNSWISTKMDIQDYADTLGIKNISIEKTWTPFFTATNEDYSGAGYQLYVKMEFEKPNFDGKYKMTIPLQTFGSEEKADKRLASLQNKLSEFMNEMQQDKKEKEKKQENENKKLTEEHINEIKNMKASVHSVQKITKHLKSSAEKHGGLKSTQVVFSEHEVQHTYKDGVEDSIYTVGVLTEYNDGHVGYVMFEYQGYMPNAENRAKAVTKTLTKHFGKGTVKQHKFLTHKEIKQAVLDAKEKKEKQDLDNDKKQSGEGKVVLSLSALKEKDPKYEDHEYFENSTQENNSKITDGQLKRVTEHGKEWIEFDSAKEFNLWENGSDSPRHGHAKKWWNKIKEKAKEKIKDYTGESGLCYRQMNKFLRGIYISSGNSYTDDAVKEACDSITEAINDYDLKDNITVYRGVNISGFLQALGYDIKGKSHSEIGIYKSKVTHDDMMKLKGGMYMDNAFLSTSITRNASFTDKDCHLKIRVPKGKGRVSYIAGQSKVGSGEEEILLNSNSQIYIHDVKKNSYGKYELICELIDKDDTARFEELSPKQHVSAWLETEEGKAHKRKDV